MPARYALVSVYDKTGLETIVAALGKQSIRIIGSGGTAEAIRKAGYEILEVSDYTGTPEMPGGLVKTLHPRSTLASSAIGPFQNSENILTNKECTLLISSSSTSTPSKTLLETIHPIYRERSINIDIGGVALIRAAAKGALLNNRVVPVTSPQQYDMVRRELVEKNLIGDKLRQRLAKEAFNVTAEYDKAIRDYLVGRLKQ